MLFTGHGDGGKARSLQLGAGGQKIIEGFGNFHARFSKHSLVVPEYLHRVVDRNGDLNAGAGTAPGQRRSVENFIQLVFIHKAGQILQKAVFQKHVGIRIRIPR